MTCKHLIFDAHFMLYFPGSLVSPDFFIARNFASALVFVSPREFEILDSEFWN